MHSLQSRSPRGYVSAFTAPFMIRPRGLQTSQSSSSRQSSIFNLPRRWRASPICTASNEESPITELTELPVVSIRAHDTSKPVRTTRVGLIATAVAKRDAEQVSSSEDGSRGLFGLQARAYWESMGVLPLFFTGIGVLALVIKRLKVMQGSWKSRDGVNRAMTPDSVITSPEMERELHVFKCGGCGYEIYPARGREFKFFPDSFKCPLCETPKSQFWDLNDPSDPRNQESEDDESLQPAGVQDINATDGTAPNDKNSADAANSPRAEDPSGDKSSP